MIITLVIERDRYTAKALLVCVALRNRVSFGVTTRPIKYGAPKELGSGALYPSENEVVVSLLDDGE